MSVYPIKYKKLNKETGRKVSVTRYRVQIRKNGKNITKLFDDEATAKSWEHDQQFKITTGVEENPVCKNDIFSDAIFFNQLLKSVHFFKCPFSIW